MTAPPTLLDMLRPRALRWLAQREQSEAELRRKLTRLAVSLQQDSPLPLGDGGDDGGGLLALDTQALIDDLILWLRERHYLSDQRFVESRLRTRQARFGTQRIQQELSQHGLSLGDAERQHLAQTELQRAHAVWARKFGPELPHDARARATQVRFLMQRGFAGGVIRRVLGGEGAEEGPEA